MNELHLFAGAGGGILAGQLRGNRCVCAVEREPYAQAVLVARQNDGTFPPFPIWDDVRTFDGRPWRGVVDVVAGGFPCQDVSVAGSGDGLDGERSGLWAEMARIIREVRPLKVEVENSPMLTSRGLGRVLGDLAAMGFDAQWGVLSAADCGAFHIRERIWILAHANGESGDQGSARDASQRARGRDADRCSLDADVSDAMRNRLWQRPSQQECEPWRERASNAGDDGPEGDVADALRKRRKGVITGSAHAQEREGSIERSDRPRGYGFGRWPAEPGMGRVVNGMAHRSHRIRALGNGQVPRVAAAAFTLLSNE